MATAKKQYFYGRAGIPVSEKLREYNLPQSCQPKREMIQEALKVLDTKAYISTAFMDRLMWHLTRDIGLPKDIAQDLIAKRFGYAGYPGLKRSKKEDEEYHKQRAKEPSIQAQIKGDMRSGKLIAATLRQEQRAKERQAHRLIVGDIGGPKRVKHKSYFFFRHTDYLVAIENLMADYNDCYLQAAVDSYPKKMTKDDYFKSFGVFWKEILKLQSQEKIDFSIPGLLLIKRLCHYLYSWNFRRYMADEIIARYAPYLPVQYRILHVAAKRDTSPQEIVDETYPDLEFEEDPDDNIGNR